MIKFKIQNEFLAHYSFIIICTILATVFAIILFARLCHVTIRIVISALITVAFAYVLLGKLWFDMAFVYRC